jgi:hypothetical protein
LYKDVVSLIYKQLANEIHRIDLWAKARDIKEEVLYYSDLRETSNERAL